MNKWIVKKTGILSLTFGMALASVAAPCMPPNTGMPVTVYAAKQTAAEKMEFKMQTYKHSFKTKDGAVYKEISYQYPVAQGESAAAQKINRYFKLKRAKWIKAAKGNLEEAKEMAETSDIFYADDVTCKVTCNDGTYISVLQSGDNYTGGAHGTPYLQAVIFDAATGEKVTPANILGVSKKALNKKVVALYLKKYDKTEGTDDCPFFTDDVAGGRDAVEKSLSSVNFNGQCYIKGGKLRFYVDPYVAGPYAAGFIEVSIKKR